MDVEHYWAPTALDDALARLADGEATVLAGGTDLMPQLNAGRVRLKRGLLNVRRVAELATVAVDGGMLRVGAGVTITDLAAHPAVREHAGVLADACDHFASDQLRNAATLGGNVCNASPAGDTLVPLLALDAQAELAGKTDGSVRTRCVPLDAFFTGPGRTVRAPHELLVALRIPLRGPQAIGRFHKFGTRPALDISTVSLCVAGTRRGGALHDVRVACGAVAPVPMRARAAEAALEGVPLTQDAIARAAAAARDEVRPIDDVRASAWYRRELVFNLMRRVLDDVARA